MNLPTVPLKRCAVYCRVSSDGRLDQSFNSIDAQREAGRAYIVSQRAEGWIAVGDHFEDGGYSGGNVERPALRRLLADIELGKVDVVVVYKIDRLSRALSDFARMVEVFDRHGVSFVSVTQQFNTTTSMGRLTLNILLSFAQFEREVIGTPFLASACFMVDAMFTPADQLCKGVFAGLLLCDSCARPSFSVMGCSLVGARTPVTGRLKQCPRSLSVCYRLEPACEHDATAILYDGRPGYERSNPVFPVQRRQEGWPPHFLDTISGVVSSRMGFELRLLVAP